MGVGRKLPIAPMMPKDDAGHANNALNTPAKAGPELMRGLHGRDAPSAAYTMGGPASIESTRSARALAMHSQRVRGVNGLNPNRFMLTSIAQATSKATSGVYGGLRRV